MNNRALTLSLVMAILAVFFVQSYVSNIEEKAKKEYGAQVLAVVAKQDIHEDDDINETMLELKSIPKTFLEPGAIAYEKTTDKSQITNGLRSFSGLVAIVPIKKGEQISFNKVVEPGIRTGLAPEVTPGRRAIAVPVSDTSGVGKLVKPGDRVDVIAVLDMGGGKENRIAKTLLQDVGVLAVGHNVTGNVPRQIEPNLFGGKPRIRALSTDSTFSTVTLEVDPAQAQALALILNNGNNAVVLSLRNNDDTDRQNMMSTSLTDVLGPDSSRLRFPAGRR